MQVAQLKAARAILGWSQEDLAKASGLSIQTIKRIETDKGLDAAGLDTVLKVESTLENAGIDFIDAHLQSPSGGVGVRLRYANRYFETIALRRRLAEVRSELKMLIRQDFDAGRRQQYADAAAFLDSAFDSLEKPTPDAAADEDL